MIKLQTIVNHNCTSVAIIENGTLASTSSCIDEFWILKIFPTEVHPPYSPVIKEVYCHSPKSY